MRQIERVRLMTVELEQELKVLLTKEQFDALLHHWKLDSSQPNLRQHNTYYDTNDQLLKHCDAALRLRNFADSSVWTIKHRQNAFQSLEYHQPNPRPLSPPSNLSSDFIQEVGLLNFLKEQAIELNELKQTYDIQTQRWLITAEFGEFALDASQFGDQFDYELELETDRLVPAQIAFKSFLDSFGIKLLQAETKLSRAANYFKTNS